MTSVNQLSPELRALTALFSPTPVIDPTTLNVQRFCALAKRHKLVALALEKLNQHNLQSPLLIAQLQEAAAQYTKWNLRANMEISFVASITEKAGYPLVISKGPVLSKTLYGKAYLKTSSDLDWYTLPETMLPITALLQKEGYAQPYSTLRMTPRKWQAILSSKHDLPFTHPARKVVNEIHQTLPTSHQKSPPAIYQLATKHALPAVWGDQPIKIFTNEDLFLYLCFHGAKHFWSRLNWLVDVNEMITNQAALNLNLPAVQATAQEYQLTHCLTQAYDLCRTFFGTPLPQATPQSSKHRAWLTQKALEEIASDSPETQTTRRDRYFNHLLYDQRLSGSWKASAHFLWQQRLKVEDFFQIDLPDSLFFLYTLLRPLLWLTKKLAKK